MENFIKDRNEAFASGDITKIKAYCEKYNIVIPEDEKTFLAGVHKAICNLYLLENSPVTLEQFQESFDWLEDNGYSPSITFNMRKKLEELEEDGGEEECSEN